MSFFEDVTQDRSAKHKLFLPIMKKLWQHKVKHTLAHPATLWFTWRGQQLSFSDAQEAETFIQENIRNVEDVVEPKGQMELVEKRRNDYIGRGSGITGVLSGYSLEEEA